MTTSLATGCLLDFGYDIEAVEAFEDSDGADGGGTLEGCVEGPTEASEEGPQIQFLAGLTVDQEELTIRLGDVVTWTNTDSEKHTTTAGAPGAEVPLENGGFDSGRLGTGDAWAFRFCSTGTVVWFCATHPATMNNYQIIIEQ